MVDKIFFYYAPKILGGTAVAAAGGRDRTAAARGCDPRPAIWSYIPSRQDEFAVEARIRKDY